MTGRSGATIESSQTSVCPAQVSPIVTPSRDFGSSSSALSPLLQPSSSTLQEKSSAKKAKHLSPPMKASSRTSSVSSSPPLQGVTPPSRGIVPVAPPPQGLNPAAGSNPAVSMGGPYTAPLDHAMHGMPTLQAAPLYGYVHPHAFGISMPPAGVIQHGSVATAYAGLRRA